MSWQERYSSKLNRSSWIKTAHNSDHPHVEDENDLQSHLMSHHEGDFIGDLDDHEWFHSDPSDYIETHRGVLFPMKPHSPDHYHTNDYEGVDVPDTLPKSFASFNKLADPTDTLRGEGASAFTEPSYQDDQEDGPVGPQDLDSNATEVDKFPKSVGVFKNSSWKTADSAGGGQFGNPIDENQNRMQSLESPGLNMSSPKSLEVRYPLDTGQRNYSEQRADANPLTLRSWFTGDDVNGPWPHTKNLTGPLDFEPTDDQNKDSTGPIMGSFNSRISHFEDVSHPWPETEKEAQEHIISHHENVIQGAMKSFGRSREHVIDTIRSGRGFLVHGNPVGSLDGHIAVHKNPNVKSKHGGPDTHEHDDDNLNIDVPDNMETISPTYITSSWHQSFVETFDTHPNEESPDTLLNPADELKNGRPRANDLPNQSAQLLPGMLIDHDAIGGSGTDTGSF